MIFKNLRNFEWSKEYFYFSTACSALTRLLYELTRLGCAKGRADMEQLKLFAGILRMTRRKEMWRKG